MFFFWFTMLGWCSVSSCAAGGAGSGPRHKADCVLRQGVYDQQQQQHKL